MDYFNVPSVFQNPRHDSCSNTVSFTQPGFSAPLPYSPSVLQQERLLPSLLAVMKALGSLGSEGEDA